MNDIIVLIRSPKAAPTPSREVALGNATADG
jgi:hypothetical protein